MRELQQRIACAARRAKADHEMRLVVAALQTAELVNVVGSLGAGSKWRPVSPKSYFEAWSGQSSDAPAMTADEYRAKMAVVEAQVKARYEKRRAKRIAETSGQNQNVDQPGY